MQTKSFQSLWGFLPRHPTAPFCPRKVEGSVVVPPHGSFWRKFLAVLGPGLLVAVSYMDSGNWATDIAAGSRFGYELLSVIFLSNLLAVLLQFLSLRLGIATGQDLAQICRQALPAKLNFVLWLMAEFAIIACDLADLPTRFGSRF